jgi:predicted ribosome quality control (RQC) complex YloA/Tae2 family protein
MLRARLEGAKLVDFTQPPFDRTLTLNFETMTGALSLAIEIMGRHSNIILVHDGLIMGSLKLVPRTKSTVREVLPGRPYTSPPRDRPTPVDLTPESFADLLQASADPLAQRLSKALLGISPTMATELAVRSQLDPQAPAGDIPDASRRLWPLVRELTERVRTGDFAPTIYYEGPDPVGYTPFPFVHFELLRVVSVPRMSDAIEAVVSRLSARSRIAEEQMRLARVVKTAYSRMEKTVGDLRRSLQEAEGAAQLKTQGELLLAYAASVPQGARTIELPGYDEAPVRIPLDPTLSPVKNAQRLFQRYTKLKTARLTLEQRLHAAESESSYLQALALHIDQAETPDDLFDLQRELVSGGYLRGGRTQSRPTSAARARSFRLRDGKLILVGRSNLENDYLTFKVADPDDLWFHARGVPGAHVVLRLNGGRPTERAIHEAAALAAYFSQARDSGKVAVDYTERRHVRKPRGAKPGVVVYEREHTIHVVPIAPEKMEYQDE